ncbi:MAG: hypothetical protein BWK73_51790 [Thiothrix lacustris]|uniref:Uncharacterized protein n=1 Tax=Thiothrix lacustris TaxID=525917 RepID=A0A1Y1Q7S7_9GAMM|nr:MAG: hypothetical protein BWK73_51790 [Thiothrix lacustris]
MTHRPSRFATLASTTLLVSSLALLSACGGGSSGTAATDTSSTAASTTTTTDDTPDTSVKTGVFIDAPVKGLTYKTATQSGVTNDKGEFKYITGETVTFSLDGVALGSGKAQAKLPVTLISTEGYVAQFLQTMDTDANPDLIDVSKIKLDGTTIANFKTKLADVLKTGRILEKDNMYGQMLDGLLTPKVLTEIQTSSQVVLANQTVVGDSAAAKHVYNAVGSTPWQTSETSGMVNADDREISIFNTDGTFTILAQDFGDPAPNQLLGTWQMSNGQVLVSFTEDGKSLQYKVHKISQDGDVIDAFSESTTDATDANLFEFHKAQPLTLAALNGKHLSFDMTGNIQCTAMTLSFSGATATLRDKCGGKYDEGTIPVEEVAGANNLIKLNGGDGYMLLALASGDLTKGRMIRAEFGGSTLEGLQANDITAVSAPLQP